MASFNFRVLLETVQGKKTSYYSSSFVNTANDLVLSSSQVYDRITGSISCSYQNQSVFTGSDINTNFTFKDNVYLSASLSGKDTGSISFIASDSEYDRLLRYKFFGEKVCGVLGIPENYWVYVDQLRLPADDETNYFEGNILAKNIFVSDTITFANSSNINSDIPIYIDTGSDRYIKFVDITGNPKSALLMGYDKDKNRYEISASSDVSFVIKGLDSLQVNQLTSSIVTSSIIHTSGSNIFGDASTDTHTFNGHITASNDIKIGNKVIYGNVNNTFLQFTDDHAHISANGTGLLYVKSSGGNVGINTNAPSKRLTVAGDISASGKIFTDDEIHVIDNGGDTVIRQYASGDDGRIDLYQNNSVKGALKGNGASYLPLLNIGKTSDITSATLCVEGDISSSEAIHTLSHITASGNISSSGDLISNDL